MTSVQEETIIQKATKIEPEIKEIIEQNPYEEKGIFNSEALLFISIVEILDVDKIIESGRARGHSTKILSEYFANTDVEIVSIEKKRGEKMTK